MCDHLPPAQLAAVIDCMCDRKLIGDDGWLSEPGRAVKRRIEALTDDLAAKLPHPRVRPQPPSPTHFTLADTTFHFLDATLAEASQQAKDAAEGKDVRVGGGVATVRQFLEADAGPAVGARFKACSKGRRGRPGSHASGDGRRARS